MSRSEIINASIEGIDCNPFRNTGKYPYIKDKVAALKRSIEAVGLWEGVIARKKGNRYEIAFGHHRMEAARQLGMKRVPVIVRDLSDEEMLQFMGRENGEDYNAYFLTMLETWEAAHAYLRRSIERQDTQAIDVARLLGWTKQKSRPGEDAVNMVAASCNAARALIKGGYLSRSDLDGISVSAAREIVERAYARMKQLDAMAKQTNRPAREVERAKAQVAKAAQSVAQSAREGKVATKQLRNEVDNRSYELAAKSRVKDTPLFAAFAQSLVKQINKLLVDDAIAERLHQIEESIGSITMESDHAAVRAITFALAEHAKVANGWTTRLVPASKKVVNLRAIENKR